MSLRRLIDQSESFDGPLFDLDIVPVSMKAVTPGSSGFVAFKRALLVPPPGLLAAMADDALFAAFRLPVDIYVFGFDLFGNMFATTGAGAVVWVDVETSERKGFAEDLEEWAEKLLADSPYCVGSELANTWQAEHGQLGLLERLVPRRPFVLGGEYEVSNLTRCSLSSALSLYGLLCSQINEAPDGTPVEIHGWSPADAS